MFGLSGAELAIIGVIIVLIFGVGRITKIGSELGGGLKSFRDALKDDDKNELEHKKEKIAEAEIEANEEILEKKV